MSRASESGIRSRMAIYRCRQGTAPGYGSEGLLRLVEGASDGFAAASLPGRRYNRVVVELRLDLMSEH
jgi:hypothetical protein